VAQRALRGPRGFAIANPLTESVVEQVALAWLESLGYQTLAGLGIAPGETSAERSDYKQVFLFDRLQTKLEDLNPKIPPEGLEEALRKVRHISHRSHGVRDCPASSRKSVLRSILEK
jgi:type I site-specific restriction-modification system R (restriction) subunit